MEQPECRKDPKYPEHFSRLRKSLYGPKRSFIAWYKKVDPILRELGVVRSKTDNSVNTRKVKDCWVQIALCVDDLIIACPELAIL